MPGWVTVLLIAIINFIFGFFLKSYLPSYMKQKGENLATREDVQKITELTEEVKSEFEKDKTLFTEDLHFKYKYYYEQYDQLYSYLYACVVQSEYTRKYLKDFNETEVSEKDAPYIQISPRRRRVIRTTWKQDGSSQTNSTETSTETPLSEMTFENLVAYIIENGALADQKLLKLSLAYRLVNEVSDKDDEKVRDELVNQQGIIVKTIVEDYNRLRRELKMDFDEDELENGKLSFFELESKGDGIEK